MKRFSFFLAVFSVGLVMFLLLTGQFGKLFQGSSSRDGESWGRMEAPEHPAAGEKLITYHKHDYDRGRLQFTLRGEIEGPGELLLTPNAESMDKPKMLRDAKLEIPLYPAGEVVTTAEEVFTLGAELVVYDPGVKSTGDAVTLKGAIHGEGSQGYPVFDTHDVLLTWPSEDLAHLTGEKPVQIEYPAVTLRGQNGFEAQIDGREGLSDIRIEPPLVVALSSDAEGSILGFRGGALLQGESGDKEKSRVHLFSEGPMHIDTATGAAIFEGPVQIYQVAADTSLDPPDPKDLPENRFRCERLRLELDSESRRVTRLIATRVNEPVQVHLTEGYRVEGSELVWSDGDQEAVLSGDVRIIGELGEFRAGRARILPDQGICWLIDGIEAHVRGDALTAGDGDGEFERRVGGKWILGGDRAELRYDRGARGQQLKLFRALAAKGERVTIREDREGGALLLGGEMLYEPGLGAIRVLSGDQDGALRPDFREGRNRAHADRIDLMLTRPELVFEGAVDVSVFDPPIGAEGVWPKWLEPGTDDETHVTAERVQLSFDENHRLSQIEAWRGEAPLVLDHHSEESFRVQADAIDWDGPQGRIRAFGDGRQTLTFEDRAEISGREIVFSLETWVARGDGEVHCVAHRSAPSRGEGPAPRPVTIDGDHLEVTLRPPGAALPKTVPPASPTVLRAGEILGARGWSDTQGTLQIEEGSFRALGDELAWDSVEGVIRLLGRGRQRVIYRGPEGPDEITAQSLVYYSADRRLLLEGETRARLHQGSVPGKGAVEYSSLPWDITSGSFEVFFREDGEEDALALEKIVAGDKVVLTQAESEIEFRGDVAEWDARTERLRVYSPGGQGLQTLYRGTKPRDELVAREVLLIRPAPERAGMSDRIEVLFIDVLSANIHIDEGGRGDTMRPEAFTIRADNLLLGLSGTREPLAPGVSPMPIDEARAWGNVDFLGGSYRIVSQRAIFRRSKHTLVFQGDGRQKVQILLGGQAIHSGTNEMELKWRPGEGYIMNDRPSRGQWSAQRIEDVLKVFGREDRIGDSEE